MTDDFNFVTHDYSVMPHVRRPASAPMHPSIYQAIDKHRAAYAQTLASFNACASDFASIPANSAPGQPHWDNYWFPPLDAISLYCFLVQNNPRTYLEIGSGESTTFARHAIAKHKLRTKIISIDPKPRSEIDSLCDTVIRQPLESCDLSVFAELGSGDVLLCDNSHRSFQNSDVTVFVTEIMPETAGRGVLTAIHDIYLPYDYPEAWLERKYNEQYLLVGHVLGAMDIVLPNNFVVQDEPLRAIVGGMLDDGNAAAASKGAGLLWFRS